MSRQTLAVTMLGLLLAMGAAACDKGPMQRTGEKIDRATGQDKIIGTGPLEQAGQEPRRGREGPQEARLTRHIHWGGQGDSRTARSLARLSKDAHRTRQWIGLRQVVVWAADRCEV